MSQTVSNGRGNELEVTTTKKIEYVTPNPTNGGGDAGFADSLHVWNTGASDVRIVLNLEIANADISVGALIPAGEDHYFMNFRNPITKFVYATDASTSTIKFAAS